MSLDVYQEFYDEMIESFYPMNRKGKPKKGVSVFLSPDSVLWMMASFWCWLVEHGYAQGKVLETIEEEKEETELE